MRVLILALGMLLAAGMAWAEPQGYQSKLTATITIDMSLLSELGVPTEGQSASPSQVTFGGNMKWVGSNGRVELQPPGEPPLVTLYDGAQHILYYLDPDEKTAYKTLLAQDSQAIAGPMSNPALAVLDWHNYLNDLKAIRGVVVKDLGATKVQGYDCNGIELTIDPTKTGQPESGMVSTTGTTKVTAWVAGEFGVPVSIELATTSMTTKWTLSEVKPWAIDKALLEVPAGYTVKEQDSVLGE